MVVYDFEVFKHDWILCWLDTTTRKTYHIVNNKPLLEKFYEHYKNQIFIGYNSRGYDQWILKGILSDFNPYDISDFIINKERKGFEYSRLLNKFPILNFDCSYFFRSLKELEAFMGHDIRETPVPFDIDRKLTGDEINEAIKYCKHDVMETFEVFVETKKEFESQIGLIKEYDLPPSAIGKTKAQISATILGAVKRKYNDEFDITLPDTLDLGKYSYIADWYVEWARTEKNYDTMSLSTKVFDVDHNFGIGGLHGSRDNYYGDGYYLMADVASYYPSMMIEYGFLSRSVSNPEKYRQIRDERLIMKKEGNPMEAPRKIVLNSTFGASKDPFNNLYDPLQANNLCIAGQLFLVDLLEKLERQNKCELIQSNTDGILIKLFTKEDKDAIMEVCNEWMKRTRMELEFDEVKKVVQRDVNNYIIVFENGKIKRKGAVVKKLSALDNDLPIVNRAVLDYFIFNIPVEKTISSSTKLIDFQKVTKVGQKYDYAFHNGKILLERVNRVFASDNLSDGTLMKKHKKKETLDKVASTPDHCFIDNTDITEKEIPRNLDKKWYVDLAKRRIKEFI